MHLSKCILAIVLFMLAVCKGNAQDAFLKDFAPVAPTPASLGKYGEIPVGYHTGVPDISIPIHTLSEGAISVNVGLSYHASGIRVQETASWVGLGWALNAGGVITRTVQGAPDEGGNNGQDWAWYLNKGNPNFGGTTCPPLSKIGNGQSDSEPDIFSFNVGGYSGKFFYDSDTIIQIVPRQDITIKTCNIGTKIFSGWILTDPQGNRYHFGATDATMTMTNYVEKSVYTDDPFTKTRNSSWYLSKIESADRKDVLTFSYVEERYGFWEVSTTPTDGGVLSINNTYCSGGSVKPPIVARIEGRRLSSIVGSNGSIVFTGSSTAREDLSNFFYCAAGSCTGNTEARALESIEIRDKSNSCLRKFVFTYNYTLTTNPGNPPAAYLPSNGDETDKKRLTLLSVSEQECGTSANAKTHTFEYYDLNLLPRRLSFAQDHWGYFNGKTTNVDLNPGYKYQQTFCNSCQGNYAHTCTPAPENREPAFPSMRNGTLKKITFPTGGNSLFDFEAHTQWGTDTTCTEAGIDSWTASTGSCSNGGFNTRTYTFTATQIATGHIELKWSNFAYCSTPNSGNVYLEVYAGPTATGTPIASIGTGGSNNGPAYLYSYLSKIGGVTLSANTQYTFKLLTSSGVGEVRFYALTRTPITLNKIVGGLRIKTITTNDGDSNTANNIVKNYEYVNPQFPTQSSGKLVHKPLYLAIWQLNCFTVNLPPCQLNPAVCDYPSTNENTYFNSCPTVFVNVPELRIVYAHSSLQPMQSTMGSHIGYTAVQVKETNNGKSEYRYNMGQYENGPWVPTGYPFPPAPYEPLLGTLASESHFDQNGSIISSVTYSYQNYRTNVISIFNRHANKVYLGSTGVVTSQFYDIYTGYVLLNNKMELLYNSLGESLVKNTDIGYAVANGHYQKTTEDVTNSDGTVYRTKYKYAKDYPCPTSGACTSTNAEMKAIFEMRARNMVAIPIEQTSWLKRTGWGAFRLTGATYFQYDKVNSNYDNTKPKAVFQVRTAAPLTDFVESSGTNSSFTKDTRYTQEYNFQYADSHGKLLSQWKQHDPAKQQYIWGYNQKLPIAKIINAESTEVAFTSFEETNYPQAFNGNWVISGSANGHSAVTGNAKTGKQGFNIANGTRTVATSVPAGTYVVSFWYRDGQIKVNNVLIGSSSGSTWTYGETTVTFSSASNSVNITGSAANTYLDELRLFPSDALMRTFSFDEKSQLLLSIADENNVIAYYDYDNFQRLLAIRDQDRNILQTYEYNYQQAATALNDVKSRTVLSSGQTTIAQVYALTGSDVKRVFQYMDGLGRPIETNEVGQSPTSLDILSLMQYDQYGRENKKYLPYTITSNSGAFRTISSALTEQSNFATTYGSGGYGYAESVFEPSPLNRVKEQGAPGTAWRTGQGASAHTRRLVYRTNTVDDDIRDYVTANNFAANSLFVVESTDENNRLKISFTDKLGRVVCEKQQIVNAPATPPALTDFAWTYTLYDDFGRVSYIIPPETYRIMKAGGSWTYTSGFYAPMEFKYIYDARGRLTTKNVPSGGATTISYDKLDRPVLTRDANNVATYTRYDILSRPVMSGKYTGFATPTATDPLYETNAAVASGYTSTTFPTDNLIQLYKSTYYDTYDLDRNGTITANEGYTNPAESGYETFPFIRTRGKAVATKTGILKNDGTTPTTYLVTTTFYDKEYSIIQVNKQNHLSGSDISSNAYDFANRLIKSRRDHTAVVSGSSKSYTTREEYVYDHASRLRYTRHKINTANWVVTSAPVYDEMGRLLDKRLHASNYDGVSAVTTASTFNYLQSLDYTYNIRNWLTGINDPATCTLQSGDQLVDVFRMQLNYETSVNGSTAQYNGNISSMQWNTHLNGTCSQRQLYMFSYDAGNRLTAAAHRNWNGTAWTDPNQYIESGITYDLNGNLKTYTRRGLTAPSTFGDIDILSYTYGDAQRPDRLTKITDTGDANKGFKHNPPATGNHYAYDGVGNMTTDHHKKITIAYNYLNLPAVITYTDGTNRKIEWTYDANGGKLTKVTSTNGVVNNTKNYVSGIEYMNANLEAIYFAEGRLTPNGASFYYEYSVKDHLGNVRVSFRANGTAIAFIQENHYYSFGLEMEGAWQARVGTENAYQYNSKELNEDFDLNWYDYGARWYDAAVGRWWSVDPLGEKYKKWSAYNYGLDNPIRFIDPDGMALNDIIVKGSAASSLVNMLAERTGLSLSIDEKTGVLSYTKQENSGGNQKLADLVTGLIDNKDKKVTLDAVEGSNEVLFDEDSRVGNGNPGKVDVADLNAVSNLPDVQSGLLGHILEERASPGKYSKAHEKGIEKETEIINEGSPGVTNRSAEIDPKSEGNSRRGPDGTTYVKMLDYGAKDGSSKNNVYLIYSPGNTNLNAPDGARPVSLSKTDHKIKN